MEQSQSERNCPSDLTTSNTSDLPSCEGCKKRKLKCSRHLPLCSNCERLDTQCIYDGKKGKPGLRSGAVESLNRRLEFVESLLFNRADESNPDPGSTSEVTSLEQPSSHVPPAQDSTEISRPVLDVLTTLTKELHNLSSAIASKKGPTDNLEGPRSHLDTNRYTRENESHETRTKRRKRDYSSSSTPYTPAGLQSEDSTNYFSNHTLCRRLDELLSAYIDRVQPWLPILHFIRIREQAQDPSQRERLLVIFHAIQVASLRFILDENGVPLPLDYVAKVVKCSRDYVVLTAMSGLSVENLQALAIVAFTDIGNGTPQNAWPIVGSLTRTVEYLRLTVEPEDYKQRGGLLRPVPSLPPPCDFIEEEERRRVFWNIFNLDRFCSVTTGWNTSLTAADVSRRLPVCGGIWFEGKPATTPYFGIWDRSAAKIGNSITFLPAHYPSPSQTTGAKTSPDVGSALTPDHIPTRASISAQTPIDMSNVGAFAYYIESLESLSRITTYFLQQQVDFHDRQQSTAWLTRFKELDLRLVHWKMLLPHQWQDSGMSREIMPGVMDPNMTNAHTTHNTSMILLHQRIAYPTAELTATKLPSQYSAGMCQSAAIEITNMTRSYLEKWRRETLVSPQMAFAAFVSARVLLAHSRYYNSDLAPEFWTLVESLEEMHERWLGNEHKQPYAKATTSLFKQFAIRLRGIRERCLNDPDFMIDVSGQFDDMAWEGELLASTNQPNEETSSVLNGNGRQSDLGETVEVPGHSDRMGVSSTWVPLPTSLSGPGNGASWNESNPGDGVLGEADELSAISQVLMDQQFMEMDRVISYEDVIFAPPAGEESNGPALNQWAPEQGSGLEPAYWGSR